LSTAKALDSLTESNVANYLLDHPDFLLRRSEVLDQLLPPQRELGDSVTDFQRFLVARLKGQIETLKERQQNFIVASRLNEMNLARIHGAALRLCEARSLEELAAIVHTELPELCQVDTAALAIESDDLALPHTVSRLKPGYLERWLGPADVLLQAHADPLPDLFGAQALHIRSLGVLRMEPGAQHPTVCLAFGSRDPEWFSPDQATDLISFLAGIVSRRLAQLLP
jgi:uncharacterized protein YigA (DUF484 family)